MDSQTSVSSFAQSASDAEVQVLADSESDSVSYASEEEQEKEAEMPDQDLDISLNGQQRTNTLKKKFTNLRIDDVPEEEEKDTFFGKNIYKKQRSPTNIDDYLVADEANMIHFKALTKFYGITNELL